MKNGIGYYDVMIEADGIHSHHKVFAHSDYDAAVKVRKMTGFMARSQEDVIFLPDDSLPSATPAVA